MTANIDICWKDASDTDKILEADEELETDEDDGTDEDLGTDEDDGTDELEEVSDLIRTLLLRQRIPYPQLSGLIWSISLTNLFAICLLSRYTMI